MKRDILSLYEDDFREIDVTGKISNKNKISPIEVKSSGYRSHSSIDAFSLKFSERISNKILLYTKDYFKDGNLEYFPVYMAQFF